MMGKRGFSLALVLLVASIVLVIGAAISVMSTMSLNLTTRLLGRAKAEMLARSVVAQVRYEMDRRVWNSSPPYPGCSAAYPDMSVTGGVQQRFEQLDLFPDAGSTRLLDGSVTASVHFGADAWFSVDNLNGDEPESGWRDRDTGRTSVPSYSLSLVVNTGFGDDRANLQDARHFETVIRRIWPYAAYSVLAPTIIGKGSTISGNVYGQREKVTVTSPTAIVQGDVRVGLPQESNAVQFLDGALPQGRIRYGVPFIKGPKNESDPLSLLGFQAAVPGQMDTYVDVGPDIPADAERADARVSCANLKQLEAILVWVNVWNKAGFVGAVVNKFINDPILSVVNKVNLFAPDPRNPDEYVQVPWEVAASLIRIHQGSEGDVVGVDFAFVEKQFNDEKFQILLEDLTLDHKVAYLDKSLLNHFMTANGSTVFTGTTGPAKISLHSSILRVDGDLDVSDIYGEDSALYVNGNLYLAGGTLSSGNKGMLILANNVRIDARGTFKGLIAAKNTINFMPASGRRAPLVIRGAILTGGMSTSAIGNQIQNTTLTLDPLYLKALNKLGMTTAVIFRDVP